MPYIYSCRSPLTKLDISKKTPNKFDLKESLKKPLSYKPHRGKLHGMEKKYFNKENAAEPRRTDVKTMKRTQDVKRFVCKTICYKVKKRIGQTFTVLFVSLYHLSLSTQNHTLFPGFLMCMCMYGIACARQQTWKT